MAKNIKAGAAIPGIGFAGPASRASLRGSNASVTHNGVGIADRIEQVTDGVFVVGPGSLFPALQRLAERGWIDGQWGELESGRRAKFYTLTPAGRKQLAQEKRNWRRVIAAVTQVLGEEV